MKVSIMTYWLFAFCMVFSLKMFGQIQTYEEMIRVEISKRGIDQNEFQLALLEEGIDYNNLEVLTPAEIEKIRIVMRELELKADTPTIFSPDIPSIDTTVIPADTIGDTLVVKEELNVDTPPVAIYGHQFFLNGQVTLITDDQVYAPPSDYVIGVGDELSVGIYGNSRLNENFLVGSDGAISIYPNINNPQGNERVFIGGMTLASAREKLIKDFGKFYRFSPTQFTLGVSAVRRIRIQVNGEVNKPGEFNISGLNSVANVIAAAGGFTDIGGVRLIKVNKRE